MKSILFAGFIFSEIKVKQLQQDSKLLNDNCEQKVEVKK